MKLVSLKCLDLNSDVQCVYFLADYDFLICFDARTVS